MIKTLFETALTDIRSTDIEGVSTLRYESDGRVFRWVKKDARVLGVSGTAVAVGDELVAANATTTLTRATAVGTAPKRRFTFVALETCSAATGATYAKDVYVSCL
jgi:hypothetical protein